MLKIRDSLGFSRKTLMRKLVLILSGLFVLTCIGLMAYIRIFSVIEPKLTKPIAEIVPEKIDGWIVEEQPLAETEGMRQYVGKLLQFDQYVSRIFRKGELEVVFYTAYWEPGGKTPFDAGGHNPDSCWVNYGWTRDVREYFVSGRAVKGRELLPYEFGIYSKDGTTQPVIFWHLVNGEPFRYENQKLGWRDGLGGAIDRTSVRIEDFKRFGLNQRREQMFIRISFPNQDMEKVWNNPDFQELLLSVDRLGIFKDTPWK